MKTRGLILIAASCIFLCNPCSTKGQIQPLADQYLVNNFLTNPAFAGTTRLSPLYASVRKQWMGISNSPVYESITFHKGLIEKGQRFNPRGFLNRGENSFSKVGVGGGLFNLDYGSTAQTGLHLDYAYHVFLRSGRLSFGLAAMYQNLRIRTDNFVRPDGDLFDDLLDPAALLMTHFVDANAGVHFTGNYFYLGGSVIDMFNSRIRFGDVRLDPGGWDKNHNYFLSRSFYGYAGMTPFIGRQFSVEPSIIVKYSLPTGVKFQVNALITIAEIFDVGLVYRFKESVGLFVGVSSKNMVFKYQFEAPFGTDLGFGFITNQVLIGYLL